LGVGHPCPAPRAIPLRFIFDWKETVMTTQQQQRPQPVFDKEDQLNKITANLLQGEVVIAVYDCIGGGTGFVGITDRRVIIQDNSFVGKKGRPDLRPVLQDQLCVLRLRQVNVGQLGFKLVDRHQR
jgi:hypothetical protein